MDDYSDDFVDFSGLSDDDQQTTLKTKYFDKNTHKPIIYDNVTMETYRVAREMKLNLLNPEQVISPEKMFAFKYQWDPYTGERSNIEDPYGALYFHPDDLIHYYYSTRLVMLWTDEKDDDEGFYIQGHYGDAVGSGELITITGRGDYPEQYLFRLPVIDCYLEAKRDHSIPTMGPKLTDEEIALIDQLANTYHKNNYKKTYKRKRPSLIRIKKLYDQAISKSPDLRCLDIKINMKDDRKIYNEMANKYAVDKLVEMGESDY